MDELSKDEQLREKALTELMNKVAYDLDRAGLREEGKLEGKIEVALNMMRKRFSLRVIYEMTGLSKEDLMELGFSEQHLARLKK